MVIVCVRFLAQPPIVYEASTANCASQNPLLLVGGVYTVLVGSLLFHTLHDSRYVVTCQVVEVAEDTILPQSPKRDAGVLHGGLIRERREIILPLILAEGVTTCVGREMS
jgi:hypothetical protein